jgi:anti-sigma28 factor (negative regulator of flagellin synthesis)
MTIRELGHGPYGPNGSRRVREKDEPAKRDSSASSSNAGRGDRVEISSEGRALSSKAGVLQGVTTTLTQERIEAIRERIQSGSYDTPEMAGEVASRILASGDLLGSLTD